MNSSLSRGLERDWRTSIAQDGTTLSSGMKRWEEATLEDTKRTLAVPNCGAAPSLLLDYMISWRTPVATGKGAPPSESHATASTLTKDTYNMYIEASGHGLVPARPNKSTNH
jgi:hypothetical protein